MEPLRTLPERPQLVISPMRRRHLRSVLRIEQQVYPRPWSAGLFMSEIGQKHIRYYVVARADRHLVGYGGLMLAGPDAHITTLAVDPVWHRRQIGTRLLLVLARAALAREATALTLEVRMSNTAAQELYRGFGFAPAGVRKGYYAEVNEDALIMWANDIDTPEYAERLAGLDAGLAYPSVIEPEEEQST